MFTNSNSLFCGVACILVDQDISYPQPIDRPVLILYGAVFELLQIHKPRVLSNI